MNTFKQAQIIRITRLALYFFLMVHWVGCFWYMFSESNENYLDSHEEYTGTGEFDYNLYVFAIYNGLLILNGEAIEAHETWEKIYVFVMMLIGQAFAAYMFGTMANIINYFYNQEDRYADKMRLVNSHLRFYNIP